MNSYKKHSYVIHIPKSDHSKEYVSLFRYMLLLTEENYMPDKVHFENDYSKIIDMEVLAKHRLGLLQFKKIDDSCERPTFTLSNHSDKCRYVYSDQLVSKSYVSMCTNALLLKLPANSQLKFQIQFTKGNGVQHARYSRIEGFRMNQTDDTEKIQFEVTQHPLDFSMDKLIQYVQCIE